MKTLESYVDGRWHEPTSDFVTLINPSTEEVLAQASSRGVDFGAVLQYAKRRGGPALRAMSLVERGAMLKSMSKVLREKRDELLELSRLNNGTTPSDGSFDIDGGGATLAYYASLARDFEGGALMTDGAAVPLSRSGEFGGRHIWVSRRGVAVHINAFNFPVWGFAEKAAAALLAGMPVVTKPATSTALVAQRCVEIVLEAGVLPDGALQLICGSTGDLLDRLGPQDVVAFTGSAATAARLRRGERLITANSRFNVEADSLNAAVLAPDVKTGSPVFELFLDDVVREMTQKAGQKCTAVRRLLIPGSLLTDVRDALEGRLGSIVTGNPAEVAVDMGPLASSQQLEDAVAGIVELQQDARLILGSGKRVDGVGSPAGKGFFLEPTLLEAPDSRGATAVHDREVFGPVATLLPYDGAAAAAADLMSMAGGTLVTSVYSDDEEWIGAFVECGASDTGRIYIGSEATIGEGLGSGAALPQSLHGGPGRAGGGEELGGMVGVQLYMQRLAIQGGQGMLGRLTGESQPAE
jgi:oxepin-CoA hydrolase/3-oxo-5,6-dehydrosuberyl-CoA semialdehyde dehydrogenase